MSARFSLGRAKTVVGAHFLLLVLALVFPTARLLAQDPNVLTWRYDNTHQGQNTQETILTPANVNTNTFGKLFSQSVDGNVYAQPLYVRNLTINGATHNVIFIADEHDSVYAFDADSNGGANSAPLWQASMLSTTHGAASGATTVPSSDVQSGTGDIHPEIGITGTPVIDATAQTIFLVAKSKENGNYVQRLHALNILNGSERTGSPVVLSASVPGNGNGSSGGTLAFSSLWQNNRPALELFNGKIYIGFASHGDDGPWHGWVLVYDENSLTQTAAMCTSPNGDGDGIWSAGAGFPIDTVSANGRAFLATGNGDLTSYPPLSNSVDFGESILRYDLSNGGFSVSDAFTSFNQSALSGSDLDQGSGGVLLLPDQPGTYPHELVQVGKEGRILVLNRDNLGGYAGSGAGSNTNALQDITGALPQDSGLWSTPAYWNGTVYMWASGDALKMFPLANGVLATRATAVSSATSSFPGPSPVVTSNGTQDGIVWAVRTDQYNSNGDAVLYAFNPANVAQEYYDSDQNPIRDATGQAIKFVIPVVTNGKVYVGTGAAVDVYGLLNQEAQTPAPVISPSGGTYGAAQQITMTDSVSGAAIYYTTDGSTPNTGSTLYPSGGFQLSTDATVQAIASATGSLQSATASSTYSFTTQTPAPQLSPIPGTYTSTQSVTISDTNTAATIYYTADGTIPTTSSTKYSGPIAVSSTSVIKAIAVYTGLTNSNVTSGSYIVQLPGTGINYGDGFSSVNGLTLNGSATNVDDSRLQLTTGSANQTSSVFYNTPTNIQAFTTDFAFQLSNAIGDGFTFTLQNVGPTAIGGGGGGLGYGPEPASGTGGSIPNSVAIKFDFHNNSGEGTDSTGLFTNGVSPTVPAVDMTSSGVLLNSGDTIDAHITYDGTNLVLTLTDIVVNKVFSHSFPINIPGTIGSNLGYIGFTGASGGQTASQKILSWTYNSMPVPTSQTPAPTFSPVAGTYTSTQSVTLSDPGATIYYTTDDSTPTTASKVYSSPISISGNTVVQTIALAPGSLQSKVVSATYIIQSGSPDMINFAGGFLNTTGLQINGNAKLNAGNLELTDGNLNEASSVFWTTPVTIQSFTTNFTFQITSAVADGFTFTIQNAGLTALGSQGGGLGYGVSPDTGTGASIGSSVAVKFDFYYTNSIGFLTDGAVPTSSAISLTSSGIMLASGDTIAAQLVYDGSMLTLSLTDTVTGDTFSQAFPIDIPSTVGGNAAYVGFTGASGGVTSIQNIKTWTFTSGTARIAADPVFSPLPGTYTSAQNVTLTSATTGAKIYYTVDGSTPTTSSAVYSSPIVVSGVSLTIRAFAAASGYQNSPVVVGTYQIQAQTAVSPAFSPLPGTYATAQNVALTSSTTGAKIYYTLDGSTPTTSSAVYSSPIVVNGASLTISALAAASGYQNSPVVVGTYQIQAPTAVSPAFSPLPGTYTTAQDVTLTSSTTGAKIYYTVDGSTPTTSSAVYSSPIVVNGASLTISALAAASGYQNSPVVVGTYQIQAQATVATPTISPASGTTFSSTLSVSMTDTTTNSTIYYTSDGSTPTTGSTKYAGAFNINASTTLKAIATASGLTNSSVATASYTLVASGAGINYSSGFPNTTGLQVNGNAKVNAGNLELTDGNANEAGSSFWTTPVNIQTFTTNFTFQLTSAVADGFTFTIQNAGLTALGSNGGGLGYGVSPDTGKGASIGNSVAVKFDISNNVGEGNDSTGVYINGVAPGTPAVNLTSSGITLASGDTIAAQLVYNGTTLTLNLTDTVTGNTFTQAFTVNIPSTVGGNTAYVGFTGGSGGLTAIQNIKTWTFTSSTTPIAVSPAFSPLPGTYTTAQNVTLTSSTTGAKIYYTLDGSTPTTSSAVYSSPIVVNGASLTISALAAASGYQNSPVVVSTYQIQAPTAVSPAFSPLPGTYTTAQNVTLTSATTGAKIYYTVDGSTPTTSSAVYSSPIVVNGASLTISALAAASGYQNSPVVVGTYQIQAQATVATPTISPASGTTFSSTLSVSMTDTTTNSTIYYTSDGSTPTTGSTKYAGAFNINASTTLKAIATASGLTNSSVATASYTLVASGAGINYSSGFPNTTGLQVNGNAKVNAGNLELTDGNANEAGSSFWTTPVNIQTFTTNFTFQLTSAVADGFTFTIQNAGLTALGSNGGGLGYGVSPDTGKGASIGNSVAVKFDISNNVGEGNDSTGVYINGVAPGTPAVNLTSSGITLASGDTIAAQLVYNGTTLTLNLTDTVTGNTFTQAFTINIPSTVGGNTAYVGFTGGSGGLTAIQNIKTWTFTSSTTPIAVSPAFSPLPGTYTTAQNVTLTSSTTGAKIYYTLDGSTPTTSSAVYSSPIVVNGASLTISALAAASGYQNSPVVVSTYQIQAPTAVSPAFSPLPGTYTTAQNVTLTSATTGAKIYYTVDGSTPTTSSAVYSAPIVVNGASLTISALAAASGYQNSPVVVGTYQIQAQATVATPTISPASGTTFSSTLSVSMTDTTTNSTIYYTSDGSTPTTGSTKYAGAFNINASTTLKAIATASGLTNSSVATASYTLVASGAGINYSSGFPNTTGLQVNGNAKVNAGNLELTDGNANEAGSSFWTTPVNIQTFTTNFTFQLTSAVADGFTFTIQNAGLTALGSNGGGLGYGVSPDTGKGASIGNSVAVKFDISNNVGEGNDSTGVYINGVAPGTPAVNLTSSGITLASGDTIAAQLVYNGTTLTLNLTDTVTGNTFTQAFTVNIPSTVGGNTAYVGFTGGSGGLTAIQNIKTWTFTSSTTPIAVSPAFSPLPGTYTTAQNVTLTSSTTGAKIYYTLDGSTPTTSSAVYSSPIVVNGASLTISALAAASGYQNSPVVVGTYQIQAPTAVSPAFSPLPGTYTTAQNVTLTSATTGAKIYYTVDGSTPTTSSAVYSAPIVVNGASLTISALAAASGYQNSPVVVGTYQIQAQATVATPTISPASGTTFSSTLSVSMTDTTTNSTIYYTSDGSTPTTGSTKYAGAFNINASTTLKAIATASGLTNSSVATASYTLVASGAGINYSSGFPNTTGLQVNGNAKVNAGNLELTDGNANEAGSSFWTTPVNIQTFTTNFTFQLTSAVADGFTFTIQNAGLTALGSNGGGLGYGVSPDTGKGASIGNSVAVKFDISNNVGEGNDSTGVYINGVAPGTPAVNLTSSGITLASGDTIAAQLVYNGTTLTLNLTDTVTGNTFTQAFTINIPSTVGGNTAYVGFTGGSGGLTAIQNIKTWTFSNP